MQLTIRGTGPDVNMLSYLMAKNPNNLYERNVSGHLVRLFFGKFSEEEVEVTIFVTPDSIELSRNNSQTYEITSYINDREFAVSSIFCTLIRTALGTALNGKPKEEYEAWVNHRFPLQFSFGPVASHLSDHELLDLFQPLGYEVLITYGEVDYSMDLKSKSIARYITIKGMTTLQMGLRQLFVLIPVLDNYKHYYIDEKEVEKIERYGEGWLDQHPQRELILQQALRFEELYKMVHVKTERHSEIVAEPTMRLNDLRYEMIIRKINQLTHRERIVDLGSGEGRLSEKLGFVEGVKEILAVEPSESQSLKALKRLEKVERNENFVMPKQIMGSLFYYDERLKNKDIMILCEVIEHIDEFRLPKIMETILNDYRPRVLLITTPNREYNEVYKMDEEYRHPDHRFEWTREEFSRWCQMQNRHQEYELTFDGIGEEHELYGKPTQMALFTRKEV
ncbi:3' terminal RNA ribose 2'-O-methyltransferase Hen1 [Ureibacillus sinduriensis]|uniref:Small RNA 2'-O-methyltransferase n=1 Tax=Ureibacillus sinduriensis BLB-1 = JCM 15800 TaxID=1384057 RepID=A0A0A3HV39_9BACL|nr:3' terminal RNA ribose 2'-O-methyltransferase Hen1 [Ureibacillus sinduriensis]KGR75105.1 methyltransferase type 12 [Ureibacillus sinduriensis BLB-1 = JCM 15800]